MPRRSPASARSRMRTRCPPTRRPCARERDEEAVLYVGSLLRCHALDPIEVLLRVVAATWVGARVDPELATELERRVHRSEAAGYAWLAGQGADALLRAGAAGVSGDREARLWGLRDGLSGVRLAGVLARDEAWSGALDALLEVASGKQEKAAPKGAVDRDRRLAWFIVDQHGRLSLEPREQMRGKGGFSKGRPVALKRLHDEAATMDFLCAEVRSDGDEFAVEGALVLPGGRRIELAELLGYLAAAPGRFLRVEGDPRFLALHDDLRRRLAELASLAGPAGKRP